MTFVAQCTLNTFGSRNPTVTGLILNKQYRVINRSHGKTLIIGVVYVIF